MDGWADPWAQRNILGAFLGHWSQQQRWTHAPGDDEKVWFNHTMTAPRDSILAKFLWSFCCPRGHRLLHDSLCTWKLISINIDQYLDLGENIHQINVYFAPTFNHTICTFLCCLSFKMYMLHRTMFANLIVMFALKYSNVCSFHSNVSKLSLVFYPGESNCRCHALKTLKMVQWYWNLTWWSWWSYPPNSPHLSDNSLCSASLASIVKADHQQGDLLVAGSHLHQH